MKKLITLIIVAFIAASSYAINLKSDAIKPTTAGSGYNIDMADYGTSVTITNDAASTRAGYGRGLTMGDVLISYDGASTNTITFDVTLASGATYRIGSDSVTNTVAPKSDARDLIPRVLKNGEAWVITTTDTNVVMNIIIE